MNRFNGSDVWTARIQPTGYWKVANPIVKFSCLGILFVGAYLKNPPLIFQGAAVCIAMVRLRTSSSSVLKNVVLNFGVGSLVVGALHPRFFPYNVLTLKTDIAFVQTIDWLRVVAYLVMMLALFDVRRAFTSRDCSWIVDIVPRRIRRPVAEIIYSFIYTWVRLFYIFLDLDTSMRSRGIYRPGNIRTWRSNTLFTQTWGIWMLNLYRRIDEMALVIDYAIVSRVVLYKHKTPIWRFMSSTDWSFTGILVLTILSPRLWHFCKPLFYAP